MTSDCSQPESLVTRANGARIEPEAVTATLLKIWQDVLHIPEIKPGDDFFDLGGDSLGAIRMLERIGREFGDELLEPDIIYTASSFAALAAAISEALAHPRRPEASHA